jgi:hypothetical protein
MSQRRVGHHPGDDRRRGGSPLPARPPPRVSQIGDCFGVTVGLRGLARSGCAGAGASRGRAPPGCRAWGRTGAPPTDHTGAPVFVALPTAQGQQ